MAVEDLSVGQGTVTVLTYTTQPPRSTGHPGLPPHANSGHMVPHSEDRSRGRTADKRSKGLTAVLAIRPLTCTYW